MADLFSQRHWRRSREAIGGYGRKRHRNRGGRVLSKTSLSRPEALENRALLALSVFETDASWRVSEADPGVGWTESTFDDTAFVAASETGSVVVDGNSLKMIWSPAISDDIWLRKTISLEGRPATARLDALADDDMELFVNGVRLVNDANLSPTTVTNIEIASMLMAGTNVIAARVSSAVGDRGFAGRLEMDTESTDVGDTLATARPVAAVATKTIHTGAIGDGEYGDQDVDLFRVSLAAGTKFTAEIFAGRLTPPSSLDSFLQLFNESGELLADDDDSAGSRDSRIRQYAITTTGGYFVGVSSFGNSDYDPATTSGRRSAGRGGYELHLRAADPASNTAPFGISLTPIYSVLPGTPATGTISRVAVADIVVDDDGQGTNVFSLSGANAADFEVRDDGMSGFRLYLKAGVVLDPAVQPAKNVTVSVRDSSLPDAAVSGTYSVSITAKETQLVFGQVYVSTTYLPPSMVARPQDYVELSLTGGPIDAATLSLADFVLTRDGVTVPWTAAAGGGDTPQFNLYGSSGSIARIGHLTAAKGTYQIRFTGDATDIFGTALPATTYSWINTAPVSRIDGVNGWAFLTPPATSSALDRTGAMTADDGNTITFGSFVGTVDFDSRPNVTTTLTSANGGAQQSGFVARYDAAGALLSAWSIGAVIDAISASGNRLTIGGTFTGSGVDLDPRPGVAVSYDVGTQTAFFLVSFDSASGAPSATHVYPATPATGGSDLRGFSRLTAITTTADGRLFFSGRLYSASLALGSSSSGPVGLSVPADQSDGFVAALAANGSPLWARRLQDGSTNTYSTAVPRNLTFAQPAGSSDVLALGVTRIATLGILPGDAAPADGEALVIGLDATSGAYRWRSSVITGAVDPGDSVPMTLTGDGRLHAAAHVLTQNSASDGRVESGMITINPATGTRIGSPQLLGDLLSSTANVYVAGLMPRADSAVVVAGMIYGNATSAEDSLYLLHVPASTGSGTPIVTSRQYLHSGWTSASGMTADGRLVFTSSVSDSDTYPTGSGFALERLISPNQYDDAVWSIRDPFATASPAITVPTGQTVTEATIHTGSYQLVKQGGGTLILDKANTHSGGTVIEAGTVVIKDASALGTGEVRVKAGATLVIDPAAGEAVAGSLVIEEGGFVDLGTGRITISRTATAAGVTAWLGGGLGDGSWNGTSGIGSSTVADLAGQGMLRALGWGDNGDGSFTIAFSAPGDTNIDGTVDILDVANFLALGKFDDGEVATWLEGDFNYDRMVDIRDAADFLGSGLFNEGGYIAGESPAAVQMQPQAVAVADALTTPSATSAAFAAYASEGQAAPTKKKSVFAWFR